MPLSALIVPLLMSIAVADEAPIVVKAYPWAPFISPMGEPFRPPSNGAAPIAVWFSQADRNQDGILTVDEMQADADRFFARLDGNHDERIDREEVRTYEWEIAPEIQVNSNWRRPRGQTAPQAGEKPEPGLDSFPGSSWRNSRDDQHDGYRADGLQGAARYGLLNIPQPVTGADADINRIITRDEFRLAASYRFNLLDSNKQGRITLHELELRLPTRPKGKLPKQRKDAVDTRIGLPIPNDK